MWCGRRLSASANQPWVSVSPTEGIVGSNFLCQTANQTVTIGIDNAAAATLMEGTYSAVVTFTSPQGVFAPATRSVELTVAPPVATHTTSVTPSRYGEPVTFTATAMPPIGRPPRVMRASLMKRMLARRTSAR